jgi:hypothetical protein
MCNNAQMLLLSVKWVGLNKSCFNYMVDDISLITHRTPAVLHSCGRNQKTYS